MIVLYQLIKKPSSFYTRPVWTENSLHIKNFSLPTWSSKDLKKQKQKSVSSFFNKNLMNEEDQKSYKIEIIKSYQMNDIQSVVTVEGKNASGKSTLQRTILLLQILVQAGCLPPCEYFESKIFHRLFFRSTVTLKSYLNVILIFGYFMSNVVFPKCGCL